MSFTKAKDALFKAVNRTFGVDVVYTFLSDSTTVTIRGVLDRGYIDASGVATNDPVFRITLNELGRAPSEGDTLLIESVTYQVLSHEDDTHGTSNLRLMRI